MKDRDVGELWQAVNVNDRDAYSASLYHYLRQLIRKLVEERAAQMTGGGFRPIERGDIEEALHDFGIDPKTWT